MATRLTEAAAAAAYGSVNPPHGRQLLKEHTMNRTPHLALLVIAVAASAALTACNKTEPGRTATQEIRADANTAAVDAKTAGAKALNAVSSTAKDIAITAKVSAALAADDGLKAMNIDVDTNNGRVSLSGTAPDAASRDRAKAIVNAIDGVVTVDNNLVVGKKS